MKGKGTTGTQVIIREVSQRMPCTQRDARELLAGHFVDVLCEALGRGEKAHLAGLGTFYPGKSWKPKKDGTKRVTVRFRPASGLLRRLAADQNQKGE